MSAVNSRRKPHIHRHQGMWFVTGPASHRSYRTVTRPSTSIHSAWHAYKVAIGALQ